MRGTIMLMFLLLAIILVVLVPLNLDTTLGQIGREETTAVSIVSQNSIFKNDGLHIIGQIKNVGNKTLNFVKVIGSFYDQRNELLGTEFAFLVPDEIISNRISNFEINFPSNNLHFKTISFYTLTIAWQNPDGSSGYSIMKPETETKKPPIASMTVSSNPLEPQVGKNLSMNIPIQSREKTLLDRQPSPYPLKITYLGTIGSEGLTSGKFLQPANIEYSDSNNIIYVSDLNNDRIQIFDSNGHFISSWEAPAYEFSHPEAIEADAINGFVYVSEIENNRIQKFDSNGTFVTKWGSAGSGNGQFNHPGSIAIDSKDKLLFVTDIGNHRIEKFDMNGNFISAWGTLGKKEGQFDRPAGITYDDTRKIIYVADTNNNRIQKFDINGSFLGKWDSSGSRVGQFDNPDGIAFDDVSGFIYVSDRKNHRVLVFNEDGDSVYVLDLAKSTNGLVIKPRDIAIDSAGKLFVVDKVNSKIHVFSTKSSQ